MNTQTVRTMCPMNCHPTLCGMRVTIEGGIPINIEGDPDHPDSQGFLCLRGKAAREIIANPKRIIHPKIRKQRNSKQWINTKWADAIDQICSHLKKNPADSLGIWLGHGDLATNYGTRLGGLLSRRFAHLYGANWWHPAMVCWGLGGFGLGLTGTLEVNTKEDMGSRSDLIILWGASMASQPNTLPHLRRAIERGAQVISIDVRLNESNRYAHRNLIIKPRSDAALALAMINVIIDEDWIDKDFISANTIGFESLKDHVKSYTPDWAAKITGLSSDEVRWLAKQYSKTEHAMIILGGSSMHKHQDGWKAPRAIACLPALTGKLGKPGTGFGPRHGANSHGPELNTLIDGIENRCQNLVPDQMSAMLAAFESGQIKTLFLSGTNMLSSFADSNRLRNALKKIDLIICHDLFENDTIREVADIVLPGTAWLEQLGCKMTNTHLYLMDKFLEPPGEAHSLSQLLHELAEELSLDEFFPWENEEGYIDEVLSHPSLGNASIEQLRQSAGALALPISHFAYPDHCYPTPSGKIEFYSEQAKQLGLPPLPEPMINKVIDDYPLTLTYGRTMTHFHSFYDQGRALPTLEKRKELPTVWIAEKDATKRNIKKGDSLKIFNHSGEFHAIARITPHIPTGTLWMRDGWQNLNNLSSSEPSLPDTAVGQFPFGVGQSTYEANVEVALIEISIHT